MAKLNLTNIVDELKKKYQTTSQNVSSGLKNYWGGVKQRYNEGGGISQFTPLSMRSQIVPSTMATAEGVRRIFNTNPQKTYQTAQDIGYGLRGALSLTPFQSVKPITPKLQQIQNVSNPQTFRQQAAQSIGRGIYGSMLTAPLAGGALGVAKNAIVGTGLGVGMGVGADLITGKKITKQRLAEHALTGFENSWVLPITNAFTNKALSITGAKNLVGKNITAPFANGQVKQGLARVFTRALAEVPAENTAFTWLGRLDDTSKESFMKDWMMNLPGNVVSNLAFAGAQGSWNIAINKEARQAINKALQSTIRGWTRPIVTMELDSKGRRITLPYWQYQIKKSQPGGLSVQDVSKLSPEDYTKITGKEAPNVPQQPPNKAGMSVPKTVKEVTNQTPKGPQIPTPGQGSIVRQSVSPTTGKVRIVNKPSSRTLRPIISKNPIKDDITGVNKTGIVSRLREIVQDNWIRVKNLQRQKGVKVTESSNPYLKEELYHGRVGTRIENIKEQVVSLDKDILSTSKKINLPDAELKKDVDKYLIAKHASERNAQLGDGAAGMTNKEARAILNETGSSKNGGEIVRIATEYKKINDQVLDVLLEGRVISKELYTQLKTIYKNHVPLQRVREGEDIVDVLTNKGFNVPSTGLKRATGSEREVADLMTNITANLEAAVVRAEKNRVNLATLEFARNNPQLGIFEEIRPKAIGQTFDGKPLTQQINDPLVLKVMEDGKVTYLKIKDEKLATVFQGIGNERLPAVFRFVEAFTRFYSGLHTRFNPEFAASNIVRDTQEMAVFMASQPNIGFKGAAKTVIKDPASAKAIVESLTGKDTEGAKLYQQMKMDGGTTGGMALSTRKQVELDIDDIVKTNRSNPRKAVQKLLSGFDNWNTIFEDSTRLSVYKQGLESGMSRESAASLAKNSTVNFNKKGTGGPIINSLYMFANASIQGSTKMLRAMKNPKVAAVVTTAVTTSVFAVNNWNDQIDPDWRDKVTDWDRTSNLVVALPSSEGIRYITLPVSWGLKPIKVAADAAYDLSSGYTDNVGDMAVKIAESAFDAYNPAGGEDFVSTLTPTVLDTPSELARNKSWAGSMIKPDWLAGLPGSEQMFKDTGESTSGRLAIGITGGLSKVSNGLIEISPNDLLYAYNAYIGGVGKFATRVVNTGAAIVKGDSLVAKEIPFLNRFYKTRSEEQVVAGVVRKSQNEFYDSLKRYETGSEEQKEAIRNYLRQQASDAERKGTLFKLRDMGIDTKGISPLGSKLGVSNTPSTSDKVSFQDTEDMPSNIFEKVTLAAQGLSKDPENTIKAIFTQEELRKIEGNAVILKRQEFLNKSNDPSLERDHIIPLGLGGDNSEENLMYVSKEYHKEKTKLDKKLIKQLQSGQITRQEAQNQVKAWVEANPTEHFIIEGSNATKTSTKQSGILGTLSTRDYKTLGDGSDVSINIPETPKYTGMSELDKQIKSKYTSALSTAKSHIVKLYEDGQITAQEANEAIAALNILKTGTKSGTKAKKPKKITLKVTKYKAPKITIKKKASIKLPSLKVKKPKKIKIVRRYTIKA